jgi:hypothetical protein
MANVSNNTPAGGSNDNAPVNPSSARVTPARDNPRGYPPFDLSRVPTYSNNALYYYHISGALLNVDKTAFEKQLDERKASLELVDWDGNTPPSSPVNDRLVPPPPTPTARPGTLSYQQDSEDDSDCPVPLPNFKGMKFDLSNLTELHYNSDIARYTNWLADLKRTFKGDPATFPTSSRKVTLGTMTLDDNLMTTYNHIVEVFPAIENHWRKFTRWAKEAALHGESNRLEQLRIFTKTRQRASEDPNEFYIRLSQLGIQSGRKVTVEGYRNRLIKPLKKLINRQGRTYLTLQDIISEAGRLWYTPSPAERQIVHERKGKTYRQNSPEPSSGQRQRQRDSNQRDRPKPARGSSRQQNQNRLSRDKAPSENKRLSSDEHQYRQERNLCFNCGHPGHFGWECTHSFKPNRVALREDDPAKSQPLRGRKRSSGRSRPRAQPVHASGAEDGSDADQQRASKRRKN